MTTRAGTKHFENLLICCYGLFFALPSAAQQIDTLASNVGAPGNVLVDGSSVYWIDDVTGQVQSACKIPPGPCSAVMSYGQAANGINDFVQDAASLYYRINDAQGFAIDKVSKAGGTTMALGTTDPNLVAGGYLLATGPGNDLLYYYSFLPIPNAPDRFPAISSIAQIATTWGSQALIYQDPGFEGVLNPAGNTGRDALRADSLLFAAFGDAAGDAPAASSTDSTFIYWVDGSSLASIWQMPLVGNANPTPIVSGRSDIRWIATPTEGAGAGSIFWTEGNVPNVSLMRRTRLGQTITVLGGITSPDRCFAVWNNNVFVAKNSGLVRVTIDGTSPVVLANVAQAVGPVGVAVDSFYVYWGNLNGQILRLFRQDIFADGFGG